MEGEMKFDALFSLSKHLADFFETGVDVLRVSDLTTEEANIVSEILLKHGVTVCLLPHKE